MCREIITEGSIQEFHRYLVNEEKSSATQQKYEREIKNLQNYLNGRALSKEILLDYRMTLLEKNRIQTVNGKISAINAYLRFRGTPDCRLKLMKIQRKIFAEEKRELKESEYRRLVAAARGKKNQRLYYLLLTLGGTGIRVSELKYITVEAVRNRKAEIRLKGKCRIVILGRELAEKLEQFIQKEQIQSGCVFRSRTGNPLDRSNINHEMKRLCEETGVKKRKVFPHNLRHLFARSFFSVDKNIAHLADVLGHSSIETTRIYVATTIEMHERVIRRMHLVI